MIASRSFDVVRRFDSVLFGLNLWTKLESMTVSVQGAKTQLSRPIDLLEQGEEVLIERHGRLVTRLVRANASKKPQLGYSTEKQSAARP
jgi:antitoxin (DNA-binding transcriptional repressor) of toxin-antitoxin stability system